MHENMHRVESAITATASGNLTWEQWPHDVATALGMAGRSNPLGFAVVRYLSDTPSSTGTWSVIVHLASALVRGGLDGMQANEVAWRALDAWNNIRCPSCSGRGVIDIEQRTCPACKGTGQRDISSLPAPVRDGISALMDAERWMEGQLSSRMRVCINDSPAARKPKQKMLASKIEKQQPASTERKWTDARRAAVLDQHRKGASKSDIARELGLSSSFIGAVIRKAEQAERLQADNNPLDRLSVRARNGIKAGGWNTVEEVRAATSSGLLDQIPNIGRVSKLEIKRWLNDFSLNKNRTSG